MDDAFCEGHHYNFLESNFALFSLFCQSAKFPFLQYWCYKEYIKGSVFAVCQSALCRGFITFSMYTPHYCGKVPCFHFTLMFIQFFKHKLIFDTHWKHWILQTIFRPFLLLLYSPSPDFGQRSSRIKSFMSHTKVVVFSIL